MNIEIAAQKTALRTMTVARSCPPQRTRVKNPERAERHDRICPFCPAESEEIELVKQLLAQYMPFETFPSVPSQIEKGQIWSVSSLYEGWEEDFFRNSPLVVVTHVDERHQFVRAAMLHDQESLKSEDEITLEEFGFAEMWNTFPLVFPQLGEYYGATSVPFSQKEKPVDEDSVLYYFRQLELHTSSFFAFQAINELNI